MPPKKYSRPLIDPDTAEIIRDCAERLGITNIALYRELALALRRAVSDGTVTAGFDLTVAQRPATGRGDEENDK